MAQTLPNGVVVPNESGNEQISPTGVAELRALGSSVDAQLGNRALREPTMITSQNLNDLIADGSYVQPSSSNATLDRNYPEPIAGLLEVSSSQNDTFVYQRFTAYRGENVHWRTRSNGTWNPWQELYRPDRGAKELTTEHLDSVAWSGIYSQTQNGEADLALGYPIARAGNLEVTGSSTGYIVHQRFSDYAGVNVYWRARYGGTWTAWSRALTVGELGALIAGKANTVHTHAMGDVAGLQSALGGKANTSHVHPTAQVTGLDSALAGKASVAQMNAALDDALSGIASAYDVAVQEGFPGPVAEWLASLVGPEGPEGPYGGTEVTDPQVASLITTDTATRATLDAAYRGATSVREYGATGDGETDDTAAVQAAIDTGGTILFSAGTYRLTANLSIPDGTTIAGAGSTSTVLDWSSKGSFGGYLMEWEMGTLEDAHLLTADVQFGDGAITLDPGHDLAPGDTVRITADEVVQGEMSKAEYQRVLTVDGGTVNLSGPVFDSYTTALAARVQRANLTTGALHGVTVKGQGLNGSGYADVVARFALARDVLVRDVHTINAEHKCIQLDGVLVATVADSHFRYDPSRTPLQYGVAIQGASQMVNVSRCSGWNDRHLVTTATSQSLAEHSPENRGIPRVIMVTGCTAHGSWQAPIDTHRGGEYVVVVGNSLTTESTGVKIRGRHSLVTGNVIVGKRTSDTGAPYGVRVGMFCDGVQVTGNTIRGFDDGVRIDTPDGNTRELVISENSILDCTRGIGIHGTTVVSEVRVAGNTIRAVEGGYGVYVVAAVDDLEIVGNTLSGGAAAFYMAHGTRTVNRMLFHGNTMRGNTAGYSAFIRNVHDALVSDNFAPGGTIRFTGDCTGVVVGLNLAEIDDRSTPGVDRR